ncbi:methyltransferase [Aurantimonas sp. Leaf443]|uniref:methyltransferase n=1 Tax=Aurantimonas sp. Leaf443 TaxID=1736378 RepID=UPI0006F38114|nr:methyltransferase [Aurantimonas sp. Leaf443]KQT88033.1 hypothetical protein ASG48_00845 [Aurantimonas sp. Leaf443]
MSSSEGEARPEAPVGPGGATSEDSFYGGRFHLVQPRGHGYRSGLDALLLAAAIPRAATGRLVDLGAGAGAVGLAAAARAPALRVTLVEREPEMAACARFTLALSANAALAGRIDVVEADLTLPRPAREAAGLSDGGFDLAATNPPFYGAAHRRSPDPLRAAALASPDPQALARWFAVAAALLRHGGGLAAILPPAVLGTVLSACEGRFGALALTPVHPAPERPAIRLVLTARRGSRAPSSVERPRFLAGEAGRPSVFADGIAAGTVGIGTLTA